MEKVDSTYGESKIRSGCNVISKYGVLTAENKATLSAGALQVTDGKISGVSRGRVLPILLIIAKILKKVFNFRIRVPTICLFRSHLFHGWGARMRWQVQDMGG